MPPRGVRWSLVCAVLLLPITARAQSTTEVVRGRITDVQQQPVADATVSVTAATSQQVRTTRTDADGKFTVVFLEGDGRYNIIVRKIGFGPAIKSVSRSGLSNIVIADAVLAKSAYPLDPLSVTAPRLGGVTRAERPSTGGYAQDLMSLAAFLTDPGDLNALLAAAPGAFAGDSGTSVMGTSPDQNSMLLDGMPMSGSNLPPDAMCGASTATTTSDPSRGGFAGAQTSVTSCRGRDFVESMLRASLIDPALTWSDAASVSSPSRYGYASGFVSGPIIKGAAHYRLSFSADDRGTETQSLLAPRAALLPQLGLLTDTIAAVATTLGNLHVPLTASGVPSSVLGRSVTGALSIDWNPGSTTSLLITANGRLGANDGSGIGASAYPSASGTNDQNYGRFMVRTSTYLHGFIDEFTTAVNVTGSDASPYLALPGGSVRVGTVYTTGQTGLTSLRFGGGSLSNQVNATDWDLRNQLSWLSKNNLHQFTFGQELKLDWNSSLQSSNSLGSYSYQTLADLTANNPASYTRTLNSIERSNHYSTLALWLGDTWRASKAISFEGGLRMDAAQFATTPDYNPAVDAVFGRRTDAVPSDLGLSPRLGFAWLINKRGSRTIKDPRTGQTINVMYVDFNDLLTPNAPRGNSGAGITLFGDIGAYHGVIPPSRVAGLVDRTGLSGTTRILSCVGSATPIPDWSSAAGSVFDTCADGSTASPFSSDQPTVSLLDPSYRAPTDWKANLGLNGIYWGSWQLNLAAIVKRGVNYDSREDINLQRTAGFTLADEGNRPVYVAPSNIVPLTGTIAPNANRINDQFGAVFNQLSDLHSNAVRVDAQLFVPTLFRKIRLQVDYIYNHQDNEYRGFNGSTAGDPFAIETAAGGQPVHQFVVAMPNGLRFWWFNMGLRFNLFSGTAYTPMVVGDINGDGYSNDRAFIANPAVTADTALASQMKALLVAAPASARSCLQAQFGRVAATNSCRGPWQPRLDLTLNFAPPQGVGLGDRLHLTTQFINAGAGLMRLLGVNSALAQGTVPPDGRLLYVTGFDPATQRFAYRVNQTFGQPLDFGLGSHRFPPVQLRLGLEYKLAGAPTNPTLRRYGLLPDKKVAYTDSQIVAGLQTLIRSPIDTILAVKDSLALSPEQVSKIEALNTTYHSGLDSMVKPIIVYIKQRGMKLTDNDFSDHVLRGLLGTLQPIRTAARDGALAVLTEDQKAKFQAIQAASRRPVRLP
jgi:hypothetical protein